MNEALRQWIVRRGNDLKRELLTSDSISELETVMKEGIKTLCVSIHSLVHVVQFVRDDAMVTSNPTGSGG